MRHPTLLSIGLGIGLALGSGATLAQNQPVTDTLTKPLGTAEDTGKSGDKSKPAAKSKGAADSKQKVSFGALDTNTDRKLSKDEVKAQASLTADFDKLDADRNGSLSDAEFAKFEGGGSSGDDDGKTENKAEKKAEEGKDKAKKNSREAERKFDDATDTK